MVSPRKPVFFLQLRDAIVLRVSGGGGQWIHMDFLLKSVEPQSIPG